MHVTANVHALDIYSGTIVSVVEHSKTTTFTGGRLCFHLRALDEVE